MCASGYSTHESILSTRSFGRDLMSLCRRVLHRRAVRIQHDSAQATNAFGAALTEIEPVIVGTVYRYATDDGRLWARHLSDRDGKRKVNLNTTEVALDRGHDTEFLGIVEDGAERFAGKDVSGRPHEAAAKILKCKEKRCVGACKVVRYCTRLQGLRMWHGMMS